MYNNLLIVTITLKSSISNQNLNYQSTVTSLMLINTYAWNIIPDVKVIPLLVSATLILLAWLRVLIPV